MSDPENKSSDSNSPLGCPVKGEGSEGCPVKHTEPSSSGLLNSLFGFFSGSNTESKKDFSLPQSTSSQSTGDNKVKYNPAANDHAFGHEPQPGQKLELSQSRTVSTIPKADFTPSHQPKNNEKWVYPSQQQYYNAMKRKGFDPPEEDVAVVLSIHNIVNEKGWSQIKEWEALRGCSTPKLKRFEGRPKDLSPKAFLRSLMGYSLPFDRHDWVVESNGQDVRYVIDFYKGKSNPSAPIAMHLDVRPAVDNPYSIYHRLKFSIYGILGIPKSLPSSTKKGITSDNSKQDS